MKKIILLFFVLTLLTIFGGAWFIYSLSPLNSNKTSKRFVIEQGETASQIGRDLAKANLIKSALAFRIYSQVTQTAKSIKPGSFDLSSNLWVPQVVSKLLAGPTEVWITVPEGLRHQEIPQRFINAFELSGKAATDFNDQFLSLTTNKEGFLFPDTYLMARDTTPTTIVKVMEDNFGKKYASIKATQTVSFTQMQIITIASIIEREAITPEDMQGVASVLENRLFYGMTLGSDVTLEYALGYQPTEKTWWKEGLTADDLLLNSSYNTRINAGLPPTPISNPGLTAIEAAMNPPKTDYLYYLSDSDGKLHFARTLEEHNLNISKYLQ